MCFIACVFSSSFHCSECIVPSLCFGLQQLFPRPGMLLALQPDFVKVPGGAVHGFALCFLVLHVYCLLFVFLVYFALDAIRTNNCCSVSDTSNIKDHIVSLFIADVAPTLFFPGGAAIPCGFQSGLPVFPLTGQDYSVLAQVGLFSLPLFAYKE